MSCAKYMRLSNKKTADAEGDKEGDQDGDKDGDNGGDDSI